MVAVVVFVSVRVCLSVEIIPPSLTHISAGVSSISVYIHHSGDQLRPMRRHFGSYAQK